MSSSEAAIDIETGEGSVFKYDRNLVLMGMLERDRMLRRMYEYRKKFYTDLHIKTLHMRLNPLYWYEGISFAEYLACYTPFDETRTVVERLEEMAKRRETEVHPLYDELPASRIRLKFGEDINIGVAANMESTNCLMDNVTTATTGVFVTIAGLGVGSEKELWEEHFPAHLWNKKKHDNLYDTCTLYETQTAPFFKINAPNKELTLSGELAAFKNYVEQYDWVFSITPYVKGIKKMIEQGAERKDNKTLVEVTMSTWIKPSNFELEITDEYTDRKLVIFQKEWISEFAPKDPFRLLEINVEDFKIRGGVLPSGNFLGRVIDEIEFDSFFVEGLFCFGHIEINMKKLELESMELEKVNNDYNTLMTLLNSVNVKRHAITWVIHDTLSVSLFTFIGKMLGYKSISDLEKEHVYTKERRKEFANALLGPITENLRSDVKAVFEDVDGYKTWVPGLLDMLPIVKEEGFKQRGIKEFKYASHRSRAHPVLEQAFKALNSLLKYVKPNLLEKEGPNYLPSLTISPSVVWMVPHVEIPNQKHEVSISRLENGEVGGTDLQGADLRKKIDSFLAQENLKCAILPIPKGKIFDKKGGRNVTSLKNKALFYTKNVDMQHRTPETKYVSYPHDDVPVVTHLSGYSTAAKYIKTPTDVKLRYFKIQFQGDYKELEEDASASKKTKHDRKRKEGVGNSSSSASGMIYTVGRSTDYDPNVGSSIDYDPNVGSRYDDDDDYEPPIFGNEYDGPPISSTSSDTALQGAFKDPTLDEARNELLGASSATASSSANLGRKDSGTESDEESKERKRGGGDSDTESEEKISVGGMSETSSSSSRASKISSLARNVGMSIQAEPKRAYILEELKRLNALVEIELYPYVYEGTEIKKRYVPYIEGFSSDTLFIDSNPSRVRVRDKLIALENSNEGFKKNYRNPLFLLSSIPSLVIHLEPDEMTENVKAHMHMFGISDISSVHWHGNGPEWLMSIEDYKNGESAKASGLEGVYLNYLYEYKWVPWQYDLNGEFGKLSNDIVRKYKGKSISKLFIASALFSIKGIAKKGEEEEEVNTCKGLFQNLRKLDALANENQTYKLKHNKMPWEHVNLWLCKMSVSGWKKLGILLMDNIKPKRITLENTVSDEVLSRFLSDVLTRSVDTTNYHEVILVLTIDKDAQGAVSLSALQYILSIATEYFTAEGQLSAKFETCFGGGNTGRVSLIKKVEMSIQALKTAEELKTLERLNAHLKEMKKKKHRIVKKKKT